MKRKSKKELKQFPLTNKTNCIKEKRLSAQNTISRNRSEYKRFFANTDFEQKFMDEITKKDVESVIYMNLSRYNLRKKGLASMKSLWRSVFTLAYEAYWIKDNVYLRVNFQKYEGMLEKDIPVENRCHSDDELKQMLAYIHEQQAKKPSYLPAYALEMQIIMGLRRGEIPPLEWKDVHEDYVEIVKEQLTVRKSKENPKEYFVTVYHTKNHKDRRFPRTKALDIFLERLEQVHQKYYPNSKYLFPAKNKNGIITNNIVYKFYRRICENLDIEIDKELIKGTHSFRRNAITDVVNSTGGNVIMASQLFGNSSDVAKKNYYTGADMKSAASVLNQRKLS